MPVAATVAIAAAKTSSRQLGAEPRWIESRIRLGWNSVAKPKAMIARNRRTFRSESRRTTRSSSAVIPRTLKATTIAMVAAATRSSTPESLVTSQKAPR